MKIVDRRTLAAMPNGTLFCRYKPDTLVGSYYVITGHNENCDGENNKVGFHGVLPFEPSFNDYGDMVAGTERITNWATVDTCDYDFDDDELFAVFSKTEIRAMLTVLQYALSDCSFPIAKFMDTYYLGDNEIDEREIDKWIE